jgi:malate dehydrogenase (oxaloacetate-decarboxylating)
MANAPSVSYSITVRLEMPSGGGLVSRLTSVVEKCGGIVTALDVTASEQERLRIDVTCAATDTAHADAIVAALAAVDGVVIGKVSDRTFLLHLGGKIEITPKVPIRNRDDLSMVYTPGVARVCEAIARNVDDARRLTIKRNTVAVVTDGSAVLGLGNLGPYAALPVMEGKAALFKRFAGIDAFPICLDTQDVDEIVRTVQLIAPVFAGINLEDISAPRCFEVEARLRDLLDIPVFHDDQHGTAIVVLARSPTRCACRQGHRRGPGRDVRCRRCGVGDPRGAAGGRRTRRGGRRPVRSAPRRQGRPHRADALDRRQHQLGRVRR